MNMIMERAIMRVSFIIGMALCVGVYDTLYEQTHHIPTIQQWLAFFGVIGWIYMVLLGSTSIIIGLTLIQHDSN